MARILAVLAIIWGGAAHADCRLALSIGMDVSGSVDPGEYRLQMDGLAAALLDGDVQAAMLADPAAPVRLQIFEWAGLGSQRLILDWTEIATAGDLENAAALLTRRSLLPRDVPTAIGQAMVYGTRQLAQQSACWRHVLDLTGDGESNAGPAPKTIRDSAGLADITVNALVIGMDASRYQNYSQSEIKQLSSYFLTEVIRGPDAFVEAAVGFEDFANAMTRKLLKELQSRIVTRADQ